VKLQLMRDVLRHMNPSYKSCWSKQNSENDVT